LDRPSPPNYAGDTPVGAVRARAVLELRVEQGLVLGEAGLDIGAVEFDREMVTRIAATAEALGRSVGPMPPDPGHDAQMFAPNCPTGMIFVPSRDGISHNVREYTAPEDVCAGAGVLLQVMLTVAES
jgi:N-carbamoyl-L-amino-acid hydrolase